MSIYKIQGKEEKRRGIHYEFDPSDEPLGIGGMGKVYKGTCVDERSGLTRQVAIKFMYSDLPAHAIERARREASISIRNENLVEMLGFIETEEPGPLGEVEHHYHVVSELLEGVMLDDLLQGKLTDKNGNLVPYAQKLYNDFQRDVYHFAIIITRNVLSGLMALHDAGYLHRDIDPTNIMITTDGHIKLIDFGIAKQMRSLTTNDKSLTVAGVFMGKPEYAAPELVLGDIKSQNHTTDIYSIGILLFQCIVGHAPFEGDRHEVLNMQLHKKLPLHLIKNKEIRKIIEIATDKSRSKRYQSAAEFRVALDHLPLPLKDDVLQWNRTYTIVAASVAAACLLGVGIFLALPSGGDHPDQPDIASVEKVSSSDVNNSHNGYAIAVASLHSSATASEGLKQLEVLSEQGNTEATYLLSRLYFKSNAEQDFCPDSIVSMQKNAQIVINNDRAHELLLLAVKQDPANYKALYELGCDFFGGANRASGYSRDADRALELFRQAKDYAEKSDDQEKGEYIRLLSINIQKLESRR